MAPLPLGRTRAGTGRAGSGEADSEFDLERTGRQADGIRGFDEGDGREVVEKGTKVEGSRGRQVCRAGLDVYLCDGFLEFGFRESSVCREKALPSLLCAGKS